MKFELTKDDLKIALREYFDRRDFMIDQDFTFEIKVSRRSDSMRAIITTVEGNLPQLEKTEHFNTPVIDVKYTAPLESSTEPMEETVATDVVEDINTVVEELIESVEEPIAKSNPFKKLFG